MFTCVIHFLFIRCEIYLLFYSIFFPCIPAGGTQVLVYTAGHTLTHCGKHLRDVIHLLKEQNTSLSQKRKKKGGGVIQFELLHTFCVIQDNFESNYLFQTQNLHSSDFCSFSLHAFPLQIQRCSLN